MFSYDHLYDCSMIEIVLPVSQVVNFVDGEFQEKINSSLLDSDDDQSLFITPSNPIATSPTVSDDSFHLDDSLLDFTVDAANLQLSSPPRDADQLANKSSPVGIVLVSETLLYEREERFYIPDGAHAHIEETVLKTPPKVPESDVNKPPLDKAEKKSVRFPVIDVAELEKIQLASKSERTHKQTIWGVNVFKGKIPCIFALKCVT